MVWGRLAAPIQGVYAEGRGRDCKQERRTLLYHSLGVLGSLSSFVIGNVPQPRSARKSLLFTCVGRFPSSPLDISEIIFAFRYFSLFWFEKKKEKGNNFQKRCFGGSVTGRIYRKQTSCCCCRGSYIISPISLWICVKTQFCQRDSASAGDKSERLQTESTHIFRSNGSVTG